MLHWVQVQILAEPLQDFHSPGVFPKLLLCFPGGMLGVIVLFNCKPSPQPEILSTLEKALVNTFLVNTEIMVLLNAHSLKWYEIGIDLSEREYRKVKRVVFRGNIFKSPITADSGKTKMPAACMYQCIKKRKKIWVAVKVSMLNPPQNNMPKEKAKSPAKLPEGKEGKNIYLTS